jgi:hypothetical protein
LEEYRFRFILGLMIFVAFPPRFNILLPGGTVSRGFPCFEHGMQTLNGLPSIRTALFPVVSWRPHSSQYDGIGSKETIVNLAFSLAFPQTSLGSGQL